MMLDPNELATLYAYFIGSRLSRSPNAGATWTMLSLDNVYALAVDPTNAGTLYAGAERGACPAVLCRALCGPPDSFVACATRTADPRPATKKRAEMMMVRRRRIRTYSSVS